MIVQRLCDLSEKTATDVVELLYGAQITGKQSREDIRNFVTGRYFDTGRFMLAAVDDDRVLATGGAVVAETSRGEIFITAMAAAPGAESALNDILRQILADIAVFPGCLVKLGIGGETKVPAGFPGAFGFSQAYSLLQMKFTGKLPVAKSAAQIELSPLSPDNIDEYVSTTNAGFAGTPNAATIQADDARQMLDNETLRCGLIRTDNHTIGCYELKLDGSDGWIESVSLLPASRGKGNGGAAVVRLIEMLRQLGSATVKLSVIDANEKAYRLYQRLGFAIDRVLSRWYVKKKNQKGNQMNRIFTVLIVLFLAFTATAAQALKPEKTQSGAQQVSLQNGFYLILEEQADPAKFAKTADDEVIVAYTLDHLGITDQPTRYFRVKNLPNVGFSADATTEVGDKTEGKTTLNVVLGAGNAKDFQLFTAANIDRAVAIVIAGKVVTAHKIRTEIVGGRIQITRCGDDACEQLHLWLKDNVAR